MTRSPFPARRKRRPRRSRFLLLLALLAATSLACITTEIAFKLTPLQGEAGEATITLTQRLTDAYIGAASRANAEWLDDYAAAGAETPPRLFPESWQQMGEEPVQIPEGFQLINEDAQGYSAVGTFSFADLQEPESSAEWSLSVNRDDPERVRYLLQIEMPELDQGVDLDELERLRAEGMGPKPPVGAVDGEPVESLGLNGLFEALGDAMAETTGEDSLEGWYALRVLLEAGMPTIAYVIELPGEILRHELDGQAAGILDEDAGRVTLLVDEAYIRQYGPGTHLLQVESVVQGCSQECLAQPHSTWDGESSPPDCVCMCDQGWEQNTEATGCVEITQEDGDPTPQATPEGHEGQETPDAATPDRDGDGVPDDRDACPDQHGETEDGCPQEDTAATEPAPTAVAQAGAAPTKTAPATTENVQDLVRDLETFLAGEGVNGPTQGQAAAGAAAISSLLGAWVALQLLSGADATSTIEAVRQWGSGSTTGELPSTPHPQPSTPQPDTTRRPPPITSQPGPLGGLPSKPPARPPAGEGTEEGIQRHVADAGDYLDAIDHTRRDLDNLINRVPDDVKNSSRWQQQVQPHLDRVKQGTDVDKAQQLIKKIESLLAVRQDVDQRLPGLSPDQRDAITWTKRGLQGLGDAATEAHQRVFVDPAKGAVDSVLPEKQAQQIKQVLDQHQTDIEGMTRSAVDLPVKGAENVFGASQRGQLADPIVREDAADVWGPREVETPDFGKGWRKAEGWYKDAKEYLSQHIWQLRDVPELPPD